MFISLKSHDRDWWAVKKTRALEPAEFRKKKCRCKSFWLRHKAGIISSSLAEGCSVATQLLSVHHWLTNKYLSTECTVRHFSTSIKNNTSIKNCLHQRTGWHYWAGSPGQTVNLLMCCMTDKQRMEVNERTEKNEYCYTRVMWRKNNGWWAGEAGKKIISVAFFYLYEKKERKKKPFNC